MIEEVLKIIQERDLTHGDYEKNLKQTAQLFSAYLGVDVTETDVCNLNILTKISRKKSGTQSSPDHYMDIAGYAELGSRFL